MTRQDELRAIGAGDCPRHGRYYGICHSCAKAQERSVDKEVWDRLIADNAAMLSEIDRLREQNARYKTALEFYAGHMMHEDQIFRDQGETAREALAPKPSQQET